MYARFSGSSQSLLIINYSLVNSSMFAVHLNKISNEVLDKLAGKVAGGAIG